MTKIQFSFWKKLNQIEQLISDSPRLPFSTIRLIDERKLINLLSSIQDDLPPQLAEGAQLVRQKDIFIAQVQFQGKILIQKACQQRYQLTKSNSVLRETEFELSKLRKRTHEQCEKLLRSIRRKAIESQQEYEIVVSYIEYKYSIRYQEMERRYNKLKQKLYQSNNYSRQKCLMELEEIRNTGSHLQKDSQIELERLHDGVLRFRQKNQLQSESLIKQLRRDAALINEEVNNYTDAALVDLENRINEMNQTIMAGRSEILRGKDPLVPQEETSNPDTVNYNLVNLKKNQSRWNIRKFW